MIHGIYIKTNPKKKWHLFSVAISPEAAMRDVDKAIDKTKQQGYDGAEVGIQIFESAFHIPETLSEISKSEPMFN